MAKSGFAAGHLRSFIERIERLEEEKKSIGADIKEVFAEAKGMGFDTKIVRKVIALRKLDAADRQEMEALLDLYKGALGMDGTPMGEYADTRRPDWDELRGVAPDTTGSLSSEQFVRQMRDTEWDRETGEIIEYQAKPEDDVSGRELADPGADDGSRPDARLSASATSENGRDGVERHATSAIGSLSSDPDDIPSFLRRTKSPVPA